MADQLLAPPAVAPAIAPAAGATPESPAAPESAAAVAAREAAIEAFLLGEDSEAAQSSASPAVAEPEPAPVEPAPEESPAAEAAPDQVPLLPVEPDAEGEGETDATETAEGIVYNLPAWAQTLPEEAQQQVRELGTGLVAQIHKAKAQRDQARSEREDIKSELETIRKRANEIMAGPAPLEASEEHPLTEIRTIADLDKHMEDAERTLLWCKKNRKGGQSRNAQGETVEWDEDQVAEVRENCERHLKAGEERREYLETHASQSAAARKIYPELYRPGSPANVLAWEMLSKKKGVPELIRIPDYELLLGDMLVGRSVRNGAYKLVKISPESKATGGTPAARPAAAPPAPKPPVPLAASATAPPARPAGVAQSIDELRARAAKGEEAAKDALLEAFLKVA